ncbi:MAG: restriction endonuclease subunit S [Thermoflexales bacterium]|nr:restriction endonuclease subunit S [Thermoflexales bacterium]
MAAKQRTTADRRQMTNGQRPLAADDLPDGWVWTTIGEVCEVNPSMEWPRQFTKEIPVSFVPMAAVDEVDGAIVAAETRPIEEVWKGYKRFSEGDVIFARITPCMENGKAAIATGLVNGIGLGSTEFHVLRPTKAIIAKWIYHLVRQQSFRNEAARAMTGTAGQLRVPRDFVVATSVPIPPLPEQQRIVAKIEALFEQSHMAREALDGVPPLLKQFRQAVLAAAFRGELAADERPQMDEGLPKGWTWALLPQIGELARGKSKHRPRDEKSLYGGPYPFIQTGDIARASGTITTYSQTYSEAGLKQSRLWPKGTLCITIAANIADTAILDFDACFPDSVVGFIANEEMCDVRFVEFFIRTAKHDLERYAPATAQKNINLGTLRQLKIPFPPLAEQRRIVARIKALFAQADAIEAAVEAARHRVEKVDQAILARAFRGELVPQDPNDEPASALLERIRAQRETKPKAGKHRPGGDNVF